MCLHLYVGPHLEEEDAVGDGDEGGPQDSDVLGLDVDDDDGDEKHEEEVHHVQEAAQPPGEQVLGNQLLLGRDLCSRVMSGLSNQ